MYYYRPHTGRFEQRARSAVRASSYGPSAFGSSSSYGPSGFGSSHHLGSSHHHVHGSRRSYDDDLLYTPYRPFASHTYDTSGSENYTRSVVNKELLMSSAAMDDNFDIANRSRNRDREVMAAANRAIVDSELHASPRSAVAASRVMRGQSMPPSSYRTTTASSVSQREVHVPLARAMFNMLRYEPPATVQRQRTRYPRVSIRPRYRHCVPERTLLKVKTAQKTRDVTSDIDIDTEGLRRAPLSILAYLRNLEMSLKSKRIVRPRSTYVPIRAAYRKAALLGSRVDVVLPERKHRTPRSSYAQAKVRQIHLGKGRDSDSPVSVVATETSSLRAHKPVYTPSIGDKPIHDVDGVKKPNIMSWQYRLYAITSPDDLIIAPRSLSTVRQQVRDAQDKLDRHRQLMDRYLNTDSGLSSDDQRAIAKSKSYLGTRA